MTSFLHDLPEDNGVCLDCGRSRWVCECTELSEAEWTLRTAIPEDEVTEWDWYEIDEPYTDISS